MAVFKTPLLLGVATLLLAVACPSSALPPLTLVYADLTPGVDQQAIVGESTVGTGEHIGETAWGTLVFRIRVRNDGGKALRKVQTRLVASDAIKDLYDGADPFASEGGKRTNYGKLSFDLEPGNALEVKRSIIVISLSLDSAGNAETPLPNEIMRMREVTEFADQTMLEVIWEGGSQRFDLLGLLEPEDWPPFTMVYEADGPVYSVGDGQRTVREVRRLEFQSKTQWVETVIEAAPIVAPPYGEFSTVGSYKRLNERQLTEFDAMHNSVSEEEIALGVRFLPNSVLSPFQYRALEEVHGLTPTRVETGILVCFLGECEENAVGILYRQENRPERVFADDSRGFPLRVGTQFVVRELRIDDERR